MNRHFFTAAWTLATLLAFNTFAEDLPADALLATIPTEANADFRPVVSPSGRLCALVRTADKKSSVIVNGKEGERFDSVAVLQFNLAARSVTYLAQQNGKLFVVRGDAKGDPFDTIAYLRCAPDGDMNGWNYSGGGKVSPNVPDANAGLSPPREVYDGEHIAYWGVTGKDWTFVFDDKKWTGFVTSDHSEADGGAIIHLSPDGKYVAFEGRTPDWKWEVFGNSFKSGKFASDYLLGITADGQPVYHATSDRTAALYVGARKIGDYGQLGATAFTADGARVVYCASVQLNGAWFLHDTGKQIAPFFTSSNLVFSPDKKSYAGFAQDHGKTTLVLNGAFAPVSYLYCYGSPQFSPDSARVAYAAQKENKKWVVVCDGVESAEYDYACNITFSPDSKSFGFTASSYADVNKDKSFIVVNGKRGANFISVQALVFSPDGQHHAYLAPIARPAPPALSRPAAADADVDPRFAAILDEVPTPVPDPGYDRIELPLVFTRDGALVYKAQRKDDALIVVGSKTVPLKDPTLSPLIFNADHTQCGYVAQSGNDIVWRRVDLTEAAPTAKP